VCEWCQIKDMFVYTGPSLQHYRPRATQCTGANTYTATRRYKTVNVDDTQSVLTAQCAHALRRHCVNSQTYIKRSPFGHRKGGFIRQVRGSIHMKLSLTGLGKGDLLVQVTA
jgi:hypothetical protein